MAGNKATRIFSRQRRLTPNQLRAVADQRYEDAQCLLYGNKVRPNGAMYMAGFVIECLLKALLVERHRNLQLPVDPTTLSKSDREVHALLFSHELDEMLAFLPDVQKKLRIEGSWQKFRNLCEEWTVYARYSTRQAKVEEAKAFVTTVGEVKKWLRELW